MDPKTKTGPSISFLSVRLSARDFYPRHWPSWLWVVFLRMTVFLPMAWSRRLGAGFGYLMMQTNKKRRDIARINLELCFSEWDPTARQQLLQHHFKVSGQSYFDLAYLAWASERRILRKTKIRGLEQYRELHGRNVILLVPHCVGINFGGSLMARERDTFTMIKLQRNPVVNWLLTRAQTRFHAMLLSRDQGLRPVLRGLKHGLVFHYSPDEDFGDRQSVFVPFFGVPTATLTTLGRLAHIANALVVPCFTNLLPNGNGYEIILKPPLEDFPIGDAVCDAARMNAAIEDGLRQTPEQYIWTFKLFKTRPNQAPSPYG